MKLETVFLVLKICSLAHFLVFQGSAGEGLSPSPSAFPVVPPNVDITPPPVSPGTLVGNGAPAPASLPKAVAPFVGLPPPSYETPPSFPPPSSAPAPQNVSEEPPPSAAPSIASLPPPPPSFPSTISPALPPTSFNGSSSPPLPAPLAPAPRIAPLPPPSPATVEGSPPPKPDEHEAPEAPLPPSPATVEGFPPPKPDEHEAPEAPLPPSPATVEGSPPPKPDEHEAPEAPLPPSPATVEGSPPPKPDEHEAPETPLPPSPATVEGSPPPKPDEHGTPEAPLPPIAPVSSTPAPRISPQSSPPKPDEHKAPDTPLPPITPVSSAPAPTKVPHSVPPTYSITPRVSPPSILPVPVASPPSKSSESPPTVSPTKPPASSSEPDPHRAPPPQSTINWNKTSAPVAASPNVTRTWHSFNAPPPRISPKPHARSRFHSPAPQPSSPLNRRYHKDVRIHAPPPSSSGSAVPPSRLPHPLPINNGSPSPLPVMPKTIPFHALPPPPPNQDCTSFTCSEPLTNAPPGCPCRCVLPIQVGLRINVALYNFFPLVSEFASEISAGIFMKLSQVRIMGANAATDDPEKTIVLTDLVPLEDTFDRTTANMTYYRFWLKQVSIKSSLFGNYEVLFVRYPGLPASPPSAPSYGGTVGSNPYSGRNNAAAVKPLGVDVGRNHHRRISGSVIAIIVLSAAFVVFFFCAIAWAVGLKRRKKLSEAESTSPATLPSLNKTSGLSASVSESRPSSYMSSLAAYTGSAKTFRSGEVEKATDNFSETRVIGEGGFGRVYSGILEDGTEVAVKVLKRVDQQGGREFLAEVEMLSRLHHRNLVKLIGICTEDRARCLVYELVPNGSVESHLHGVDRETAPLDWGARLKIALGAARGLAYLHEDSSPRVIHRDFKSSNLLLEHDFTPKVSDFGLARSALDEENKHISTRVMGTFGYVAPEYAMTGHLLVKSDVYSYGVVLLELLTSRKPVDMSQPAGQENLVSWARPLLTTDEGLESMIDPALGPDFPFASISKVAAIASMCVQPEVTNRPFMGEVVQALKLISNERDEAFETASFGAPEMAQSVNHSSSRLGFTGEMPYHSDVDVERGYSSSELLSSSARFAMHDSGSVSQLRNSGSGSLSLSGGSGKARRLWQKMRHLSGGTVSEHGSMLRLWHGSPR